MSEETTPSEPVAFSVDGLDDAAVLAAYETARTRGAELAAQTELTAEESAEFITLGTQVQVAGARLDEIAAAAATVDATRDAFSAAPARSLPAPRETAPVVAVEPVSTEVAPVVAAVPSVSEMAAQSVVPVAHPGTPVDTFGIELTSDAAGVLRRQVGEQATVREVTDAAVRLFGQFGKAGGRGRNGVKAERALAQFTRDRGESLTLPGNADGDMAVINHARNESRLDGGSLLTSWAGQVEKLGQGPGALTAAAGWCAPSENRYELCNLWSTDGMLDLPTTSAPRGGINYTSAVTWAEVNDAAITSFTRLTEAQVIADTPKTCTELPCPEFIDRRLDVAVTCITGSFLQTAGYPEVVSTWTDGLLARHAHEINQDVIAQIVTQAGAAIVVPAQGAAASGFGPDTSAANSILSAVELAAEDMRYRSYMSFSTTFEVVLPHWILAVLRADIARKNSWHTDPYALANATIVNWFSVRGIRPQFVYGWQDQQSGLATGPGDITAPIVPITAFPTTVQFLIYPAGAVVLARQDVVTLTNVYDSSNLTQNLYTALFTEEGFAPIFPCGEVRLYTANACPSGVSAAPAYTGCAVPVA